MLNDCPRCRYPLHGLPPEHACPECGLQYDAQCVAYSRGRNWKALVGLGAVLVGAPGMVGVYQTIPMVPPPWRALLFVALGAYLITLFWLVWYFRRVYRCGSVAAITSDGLLLRIESRAAEIVPWSAIAGCKEQPSLRAAVLSFRGQRATRLVSGVFRSSAEVGSFTAEVNRRCGAGS